MTMKSSFTMDFSTENAAFADDLFNAIATILRDAAEKVDGGRYDCLIFDTNGNNIGGWSFDLPDIDADNDVDDDDTE